MKEIKVGEYVRVNKNSRFLGIGKVLRIVSNAIYVKMYLSLPISFSDEEIKKYKHSFNPTDLIEVGDIVHTRDVLNEDYYYMFNEEMVRATKETIQEGISLIDILTREQYNANCYRLEEQ